MSPVGAPAPLPVIRDFAAEATDPGHYAELGPGWSIASADVIGSTGLATTGRDRDVNFVAGAAVAVLSEVLRTLGMEDPCVQFGGDGAIAAVPPGGRADVEAALSALVHWSTVEMGVPMLAGVVGVDELNASGLDVRVALQDVGNGNSFGLFLGSGVAVAERWIKEQPARQVTPRPGPLPGLETLSCRWHPVPASRGTILCVIVDPVARGTAGVATLMGLQAEIEAVVPTMDAAPLGRGERLAPRWPPSLRSLRAEARTVPKGRRVWKLLSALGKSLALVTLDTLGSRLGTFDPSVYRRVLAERSDYRKAAGGTRFVLDVTEAEATAIEALLERRVAEGAIRYGMARADATTITCLVGDLAADRHVHFVDGAGIGLWRASVMLKERFGKVG
nr:DUF3095 family protein [Azospirillum oleiclasticum]